VNDKGTPLADKVQAIQRSGDQSALDRMTRLLVDALCNDDDRSLSALNEFFGLPAPKRKSEPNAFELDFVPRARLFIDGANAHRVETWISLCEMSEPGSKQRILYESMLREFVSSRSQIAELKVQVKQARELAIKARSCEIAELKTQAKQAHELAIKAQSMCQALHVISFKK